LDSMGLIPALIRPSLDNLQPFEETVEKRMGNLRVTGRQISLRPSPTTGDHSRLSAWAMVESIRDIPPQFEREKLADFMAAHIRKSVEGHPELGKYVKSFQDKQTEETSAKLVSKVAQYSSKHLDEALASDLSDFLSSNFPFTLFDEFSLFRRAYARFLATIVDAREKFSMHVMMAHRSRGIQGSKMQLQHFKEKVAPLLVAGDLAWLSFVSIQLYIDIKHSDTYGDLGTDKPCTIDKLERGEYDRLFLELANHNDDLRQELAKFVPRGLSEKPADVSIRVNTAWLEMNQLRAESWELKA